MNEWAYYPNLYQGPTLVLQITKEYYVKDDFII